MYAERKKDPVADVVKSTSKIRNINKGGGDVNKLKIRATGSKFIFEKNTSYITKLNPEQIKNEVDFDGFLDDRLGDRDLRLSEPIRRLEMPPD